MSLEIGLRSKNSRMAKSQINFLFYVISLFAISIIFFLDILTSNQFILFAIWSVLLFLTFLFTLYRYNYLFFIISFFFSFGFIWVALSNLYIEFGGYIMEQQQYGRFIGSTTSWIMVSSWFLFLSSTIFGIRNKRYFAHINIKENYILLMFVLIELLYLWYLVKEGSPLLNNSNRYIYSQTIPNILQKLNSFFPWLFIILGALSASCYKKSKQFVFIGIILTYIIILILSGDKFSGIVGVLFGYFMGYLIIKNYYFEFSLSGRHLLYVLLIVFIMLIIAFINMLIVMGLDSTETSLNMISRILGLQGHVWYGVLEQYKEHDLSMATRTLFVDFNDDESHPTGLVALMWEIAPSDLVSGYRENKVRFSMGWPAIVLAVYGWIGVVIFTIISAIITGMVFKMMRSTIIQKNYEVLFFLIVIYISIIQAFVMGDLFALFEIKIIIALCMLFIFMLLNFSKGVVK